MKKSLILLAFTCLSVVTTFAQQKDVEYKKAIQKMILVSGSDKTYKVAISQMIDMMGKQNSNVPKEFLDKMNTKFTQSSIADLIDKLVPIYKKHLTLSEINQMIAFYQSPVGKKFAEKTPLITQESMMVGQQWGMKIAKEMSEELKKKYN
ncbi:DUF2059 domain-containing protein [Pedobacter insulae]|uniref:DUF2059 domain-containing protein n=1 Tax=Pedobacter insulae TaxID=414048 RepID=A0A1I2W3E9_9SPHI|nr:DUF2059 domain-containing protein [Pedobacter insulae]SFG95169.1 hypothetical protein SAMN04489864_103402 [Pedobacter insulae]